MDELLERLQAIGLEPEKAREVLATVRGFLDEKLPDPTAARLDSFFSGAPGAMESMLGKLPIDALPGDLGSKLKGFLGG